VNGGGWAIKSIFSNCKKRLHYWSDGIRGPQCGHSFENDVRRTIADRSKAKSVASKGHITRGELGGVTAEHYRKPGLTDGFFRGRRWDCHTYGQESGLPSVHY